MAIPTMPDSEIAERFEPSWGTKKGRLPVRKKEPVAIVVHTTGWGPHVRRKQNPETFGTAFDAAVWLYTTGRTGPFSGHYVLGQKGQCTQVVAESIVAYHVGKKGSGRYGWPWWARGKNVQWWKERWEHLSGPKDLADGLLWRGGSCNSNTIGIEVVPPETGPRGPWSAICWKKLVRLIVDLAQRNDVPIAQDRQICHSDAHPLARTARGQPWDTYSSQWTWERFSDELSACG